MVWLHLQPSIQLRRSSLTRRARLHTSRCSDSLHHLPKANGLIYQEPWQPDVVPRLSRGRLLLTALAERHP
jgi:hypothetical protein